MKRHKRYRLMYHITLFYYNFLIVSWYQWIVIFKPKSKSKQIMDWNGPNKDWYLVRCSWLFGILGYYGVTGQVINLEDPEIQYSTVYIRYSSKVTWYLQVMNPRKWHACKLDFCAYNSKLHVTNNDCHGHALHKHPLQVALHIYITT